MKQVLLALPIITMSAFASPAEAGGKHHTPSSTFTFGCWGGECGLFLQSHGDVKHRHNGHAHRRKDHCHGGGSGWHHGRRHWYSHCHPHGNHHRHRSHW